MIIDFHTHIFPPPVAACRERFFDDNNFKAIYSSPGSKLIDHTGLMARMEEAGVDYAVAMGFSWEKEEYCKIHNAYMDEVMQSTQGKIIPYGCIPAGSDVNFEDWIKALRANGFMGIGELSFYSSGITDRTIERLNAIFHSAHEHSMQVCIHINEPVGHTYPGKYEPQIGALYTLLAKHPDVIFILSHWGGGLFFYELMTEVKAALKNIYYDTAASPYLYNDAIYEIGVKIVGPQKILFGSDFPLIDFKKHINSIQNLNIDENHKRSILGENARRLLQINK